MPNLQTFYGLSDTSLQKLFSKLLDASGFSSFLLFGKSEIRDTFSRLPFIPHSLTVSVD